MSQQITKTVTNINTKNSGGGKFGTFGSLLGMGIEAFKPPPKRPGDDSGSDRSDSGKN
jgi:hypothetical protein